MSTWITKDEAALLLGISAEAVIRRGKIGEIGTTTQKTGGRPRTMYKKEDVDFAIQHAKKSAAHAPDPSFAERYTPDAAAMMFEELKKGTSVADCVITLKIHPRAAIAIAKTWDEIVGAITLSPTAVRELEKLGFDGEFPVTGEEGLLEILRNAGRAASEGISCACGKRARICKVCATPKVAPPTPACPPHIRCAGCNRCQVCEYCKCEKRREPVATVTIEDGISQRKGSGE